MSRFNEINLPENKKDVQLNLFNFGNANIEQEKFNPFPKMLRGDFAYYGQLGKILPNSLIGLDFEFDADTKKNSIIGIALKDVCVSTGHDKAKLEKLVNLSKLYNLKFVGFSIFGAERDVIQTELNDLLPIDMFEDAMLLHYLCNQDLVKQTGKLESEKGSLGFMNLYTMQSLYTDLPNHKYCQEEYCPSALGNKNYPCPKHNVWGYNSIDAWSTLEGFEKLLEESKRLDIKYSFYRDLMEVAEICFLMQQKGVNIDQTLIHKMDTLTKEEKESLFEYDIKGKVKEYKYFNPNSPKQALEYFQKNGIQLKSFTKKALIETIDEIAEKQYNTVREQLFLQDDLPLHLDLLIKSAKFKGAGKGFKAWYDERYIGKDGHLHPRFNTCGTSSGRLACQKPNLQNVPSAPDEELEDTPPFLLARKVIIPTNPDEQDLIKFDKSQLELRMCLHYAGLDVKTIKRDAFQWLVENSNGAFKDAAHFLGRNERFVAKSIAHAGNYLEGLTLLSYDDLKSTKIQKLKKIGAIIIYEDWIYCNKVVAFSGVNLAERIFGEATWENRKNALQIQETYFSQFTVLRAWQREVLKSIESQNYLRTLSGRILRLYGSSLENAKVGIAFLGQGTSADHVQGDMLRFKRTYGEQGIPLLQVHDELVFDFDKSKSDEEAINFMKISEEFDERISGFMCPIKMYRGKNWMEMKQIYPKK